MFRRVVGVATEVALIRIPVQPLTAIINLLKLTQAEQFYLLAMGQTQWGHSLREAMFGAITEFGEMYR